jgi:hypothetical protein
MNEMSSNDVHFKHIMKMYDRGGSFTKKKIGAVVCKDPKASRKDIEEVLFDSDYRDIIEFEDELGLKEIREKYNSVNEEFKHVIHVDTPTQVVSKPVAAQIMALAKKGVRASEIGLEMGFVGNAKLAADTFQKVKNKIYFELDKRNESVNEDGTLQGGEKDPCWKGYEMIGMKPGKGGSQVPNCVPKNESINEAMGNDKSMLALVDMLSNSMEHYSTESEFATVASKIAGFGKLKSLFKDVYNKYWDLGARERNNWHTKDWLNWLKKWSLEESVNEGLSKDAVVRTLTSDKNAYFLTKDGNGWILDITPKAAQQSTFHQKFDVKDLGKGHLGMKYKLSESVNEANKSGDKLTHKHNPNIEIELIEPTNKGWKVYQIEKGKKKIVYFDSQDISGSKSLFKSVNEEHDCGCNENHDCGCGGVHEHIHEDISADANGIAGLTASRANAVKDFLEKNNINSNKLYLFLKKGNLKDRMDFVTALVGKPGNPIQKKVIKQFSN